MGEKNTISDFHLLKDGIIFEQILKWVVHTNLAKSWREAMLLEPREEKTRNSHLENLSWPKIDLLVAWTLSDHSLSTQKPSSSWFPIAFLWPILMILGVVPFSFCRLCIKIDQTCTKFVRKCYLLLKDGNQKLYSFSS